MNLLELLRRYLQLGAVDPEPDPPELDAGGTGDETLDDMLDEIDPTETDKAEPEKINAAEVKETRRRLQESETNLENERAARRAAESRAASLPPPKDATFEAEEAELAHARTNGTAEQVSWLQWKIDSNRKMRASERTSQDALFEARDTRDRAAFERLELTKPVAYKKYADRVEKAVSEFRSKGNMIPRMEVLKWMIGEDVISGKVTPKAKKPNEGAATARVDRGRMPGARSDTNGKPGAQSERDKRRERLRGTFI